MPLKKSCFGHETVGKPENSLGPGGIFSGPFHQQLPHLTFQALEKAFRCGCFFWGGMMAGLALGVVGCHGKEVRIKGLGSVGWNPSIPVSK